MFTNIYVCDCSVVEKGILALRKYYRKVKVLQGANHFTQAHLPSLQRKSNLLQLWGYNVWYPFPEYEEYLG